MHGVQLHVDGGRPGRAVFFTYGGWFHLQTHTLRSSPCIHQHEMSVSVGRKEHRGRGEQKLRYQKRMKSQVE